MIKVVFTILSLFLTFNAFADGAKLSELQKEAKGYKIYEPNNWNGAKSLNFMDLRTYIEPLNKKSRN